MWPDRVSNPGPPTYESGALPIALRGAIKVHMALKCIHTFVGLSHFNFLIKRNPRVPIFSLLVCQQHVFDIKPHTLVSADEPRYVPYRQICTEKPQSISRSAEMENAKWNNTFSIKRLFYYIYNKRRTVGWLFWV